MVYLPKFTIQINYKCIQICHTWVLWVQWNSANFVTFVCPVFEVSTLLRWNWFFMMHLHSLHWTMRTSILQLFISLHITHHVLFWIKYHLHYQVPFKTCFFLARKKTTASRDPSPASLPGGAFPSKCGIPCAARSHLRPLPESIGPFVSKNTGKPVCFWRIFWR